jgi:hypothetical protein
MLLGQAEDFHFDAKRKSISRFGEDRWMSPAAGRPGVWQFALAWRSFCLRYSPMFHRKCPDVINDHF